MMDMSMMMKRFSGCVFLSLFLLSSVHCQLDYRFYDSSCPNLTWIVRYTVRAAVRDEPRMAASLLRLHFHDCFVDGCEGSVLLDDTSTMAGEKNAFPNRNSARGFEVIDAIKSNVEKACPYTVSCADILALAAREAVYFAGGPYWNLPLGRRDGLSASEDAANTQLPSPFEPLQNITAKFTSKGLDVNDVVVLSGGHSIGFAQCFTFKPRLFDFDGDGNPDPDMDASFQSNLRSLCPNQDSSDTTLAPLDVSSINWFDNSYYRNLLNKSGLLLSDQALMTDDYTASMVNTYSRLPYLFFRDFRVSMVKMANIGVLTGDEGQVRLNCRHRN